MYLKQYLCMCVHVYIQTLDITNLLLLFSNKTWTNIVRNGSDIVSASNYYNMRY